MSYCNNYQAPGVHAQLSTQQVHPLPPPQSYPPPGQGQHHQDPSVAPPLASHYPMKKGLESTQQPPSPDSPEEKPGQKFAERACCFYFANCIACCCQCLAAMSY